MRARHAESSYGLTLQDLKLTVADTGPGPPSPSHPRGLGSRIIDAYARQLGATLETKHGDEGYTVTLSVPLAQKQ